MDLNQVIKGETEGPNVVGSTPSQQVLNSLGPTTPQQPQQQQPPLQPQVQADTPTPPPQSIAADSAFRVGIEGTPITAEETLDAELHEQSQVPSVSQMVQDSMKSDWTLSLAYQEMGDSSPDGPPITEEAIKAFQDTTPPQYWELISKAHSLGHLEKLRGYALEDAAREERFSHAGYTGLGVRLVTSLFDPGAIAISAATEGAAAPYIAAMKVGKIAKLGLHALSSGASNAAIEVVNQEYSPKTNKLAVAEAFGIGLIFGGTFGLFRRNPDLHDEADAMNKLGTEMVKDAQARAGLPGSVGAAMDPNYRQGLDLNAPDIQSPVPTSAMSRVRFDATNTTGSTPDKFSNLLSPHIGEQGVGLSDRSEVAIAATESGAMIHRAQMMFLRAGTHTHWATWAKEQGVPLMSRIWPGKKFKEFQNHVYDAVEDPMPLPGKYPPSVLAAAQRHRDFYGWYAGAYQNPGAQQGKVMRSIAGAENLQPEANYVPKVSDGVKITAIFNRFAKNTVVRMVADAIKDANPTFDKGLVERMSNGYVDNLKRGVYGMDDGFAAAMRAQSKDVMRGNLKGIGLDDELVDEILTKFVKADGPADSRLKRRTALNYRWAREYDTLDGGRERLGMNDFFVTDAEELANRYSRKASGKIALAQVQVRNPDNDQLLVDGITSRAEWDNYMNWVKSGLEKSGLSASDNRWKSVMESYEYLYKSIVGNPHHNGEAYVPWARRFSDFNVVRLMNRMGLNQMQEFGGMVTQIGLKAMFSQMPSLRRIVNADGVSEWGSRLANEMEVWGVTGDPFFTSERFAVMDEMIGESVPNTRAARVGTAIDKGLVIGKSVTSSISLMRPVNTLLQQWTAKSIVQRFADMAFGRGMEGLSGKNLDRLAALGLSKEMTERVFTSIKKHADKVNGTKIDRLNLENWDDTEAAHKFIHSVSRYTRRIVLENDAGAMHRWMSRPYAKLAFQFRSFIFTAWAKRTLYNLHHLDMTAFTVSMAEIMMGAGTYAINTHLNATTKKDPQKYRDEKLALPELAKAGFARSGIASIFPAVVDSALSYTGQGAFFDARTSGSATDFVFGNPTLDWFKTSSQGIGGLVDSAINMRPVSQEEGSNLLRSLPWGNAMGVPTLLSYLMKDNPYRAPRKDP